MRRSWLEIFVVQEEEKRQFDALLAQDPVVSDAYAQFQQARDTLDQVRTARGFYPVVAMAPPASMLDRQQASQRSRGAPKAAGGRGRSSAPPAGGQNNPARSALRANTPAAPNGAKPVCMQC